MIGVAGNRRRLPAQVAWYLRPEASANPAQPEQHVWDVGSLAGAIAHGADPAQASVSEYGPAPAPARLIDGVFIAARAGRLRQTGVRFDPQLGFHFYDLDFCRAAERAGLRIGVWPIALTHASSGASIQSQAWEQSMRRYLEKWGETLPPVEHAVRTAIGSSITAPSS